MSRPVFNASAVTRIAGNIASGLINTRAYGLPGANRDLAKVAVDIALEICKQVADCFENSDNESP